MTQEELTALVKLLEKYRGVYDGQDEFPYPPQDQDTAIAELIDIVSVTPPTK